MARALLALAVLALAPLAAAQDMNPDAQPVSGTLSPRSGGEASTTFDVRATTEVPVDGCTGYVDPSAPDVVVDWGGGDLRVWVRAAFDATLAVRSPGGEWWCDDDTEGTSPVVESRDAEAGRYAVWLGSYSPEPFETPATLFAGSPPPPPVLDARAAPLAGEVGADGGFEAAQGILTLSVQAGGPDAANTLNLSDTPNPPAFCSGYIDAGRPTAAVVYDADGGTGALVISATSSEDDLVLVVAGPNGQVYCNDDFNDIDPAVVVDGPASGTYAVWVGTFSVAAETVAATLEVSETAPEMDYYDDEEFVSEPFTEGTYTPLDLGARPSIRLSVSGEAETAEVTITPTAQNPVSGDACTGFIETAPTAAITLNGDGPFALTASGDDDLTLTVRTPAGGWFCSDDADGLDPGIQIDDPEAGEYLAWVGTYGELQQGTSATVSAAPGEITVAQLDFGPESYSGPTQSDGMYDGAEIRPGAAATTLSFQGGSSSVPVAPGGPVVNPVEGDVCYGFVSERPTATIESTDNLMISASGDDDLTLTVLGPDGSWTCSDDADGTDPEVVLQAGAGTYSVWVGTYYRRENAEATLYLDPVPDSPPPPVPSAPEVIRG